MASAAKLIFVDGSGDISGGGNPLVLHYVMQALMEGANPVSNLFALDAYIANPKGKAVIMTVDDGVRIDDLRRRAEDSCLPIQHIHFNALYKMMSEGLNGPEIVERLGL